MRQISRAEHAAQALKASASLLFLFFSQQLLYFKSTTYVLLKKTFVEKLMIYARIF